jgi:hypothetical protein
LPAPQPQIRQASAAVQDEIERIGGSTAGAGDTGDTNTAEGEVAYIGYNQILAPSLPEALPLPSVGLSSADLGFPCVVLGGCEGRRNLPFKMATGAVLGASKHLEFSTFAAVSLHPLQNQQRRYPPAGASLPLLPNLGGARSREDPGRPPRWGATSVKAGRAASKDLGDDKGKVSPISYGPPTNVLSLCHPQFFGKVRDSI